MLVDLTHRGFLILSMVLFSSGLWATDLGSLANVFLGKKTLNMELYVPLSAVETICGKPLAATSLEGALKEIGSDGDKVRQFMGLHIRFFANDQRIPLKFMEIMQEKPGYLLFKIACPAPEGELTKLRILYDYPITPDGSDRLSLCFYERFEEQNKSPKVLYLYAHRKAALWTPKGCENEIFIQNSNPLNVRLLAFIFITMIVLFQNVISGFLKKQG